MTEGEDIIAEQHARLSFTDTFVVDERPVLAQIAKNRRIVFLKYNSNTTLFKIINKERTRTMTAWCLLMPK